VAERIAEMHLTVPKVAAAAGIDQSTLRALIQGRRWPHQDTRARVCRVLHWPEGEIYRRGMDEFDGLAHYSLSELLIEVARRLDEMVAPEPESDLPLDLRTSRMTRRGA
jgi:transcriptional regulator with XRE-family HTH domain